MNKEKNCICHNCGCKDCDSPDAKWEDTWFCDPECTSCACADHSKTEKIEK